MSSICSRSKLLNLSTLFTSLIEFKSSIISLRCLASLTKSSKYIEDFKDEIGLALILTIFESWLTILFEISERIPDDSDFKREFCESVVSNCEMVRSNYNRAQGNINQIMMR